MELPISDGREVIGTLSVRREGLYAVFRAELPRREGLQRLWLCGDAESVCLGVLAPRDGRLRLEKRLSRAACALLPKPLRRAVLSADRPAPLPAAAPEIVPDAPAIRERCLFGRRFIVFRS